MTPNANKRAEPSHPNSLQQPGPKTPGSLKRQAGLPPSQVQSSPLNCIAASTKTSFACAAVAALSLVYMRPVGVVGAGKTAFGAFADRGLQALAVEAIRHALADVQLSPGDIQAFYLGNFAGPSFTGQNHLAPWIASAAGLNGIPCARVENACASGGSAFFQAWQAVGAGLYDFALVAGVEKMTSQPNPKVAEILAGAGDMCGEGAAGATFPSLFAMIARRHMHEFGTTRAHLAAVAVKNHANGARNPLAHMRKTITLEQALAGKPIAEPLTIFDCSLVSDGAAAVVLAPLERAREFSRSVAKILTVVQTSDRVALDEKSDITTFPAVVAAGRQAYEAAGIGPGQIDFAELHDCFTIAEIIASEDLGFVAKGEGGHFAAAGCSAINGKIPINSTGGLKSKGHPVGATGVAQICDVVAQLRGEAGECQVPRHRVGLAQNLGGSGATCVVSILAAN
jgi:acetyl-CoA C-acetyltransferase